MNLGIVSGMVPRCEIYLQLDQETLNWLYFFFTHDCMQCSLAALEPVVPGCQQSSGHKQNKKTKHHRSSIPTREILLGPANG